MTLSQLILALRARAGIAIAVMLVTVLTALVVSLMLPKQFAASTAVLVDVKSLDPVAGTVLPGMFQPGYMSTQVDIINSDRVANRVVSLLGMEKDPENQARWMNATNGQGDYVGWASKALQAKLDVKPSRDSNVINIGFSGTDPEFVAKVANAFAKAYVDVNLELKIEPARQYAIWFEEQTKMARDKLEAVQKNLGDYQQKFGILATDDRVDFETSKLNETSAQLTVLQGQIADVQSKRASGTVESIGEVMQSPLINGLKADISRLEAKLQENSGNYGANHPQVISAQAELDSLRARLNSEIRQIKASFDTSYLVSRQREQQLESALEAQKSRVLLLNQQRNELNVLRRDVESAQRAFEAVSQRSAQTRLESQSAQTNVSILNLATAPIDPFKPRVIVNVLASVLVGAMLGMGIALMLELSNRRVRSVEDLTSAIDVPVLASIGSAGRLAKKGDATDRLPLARKPAIT